MPNLPLDHPEPFAAILGVMLYPGAGEGDRRRARAFAAQYLAEPIRQYQKAGGILPYDTLMRIVTDAGAGAVAEPENRRRQIHRRFVVKQAFPERLLGARRVGFVFRIGKHSGALGGLDPGVVEPARPRFNRR